MFSESENETVSVSAETADVIKAVREDPEFCIEFFIGEDIDSDVPNIHKEIWTLLTTTELDKVLLAIPRGHAKTTLAKIAVVWYFLFTNHRFCVYLSNTNTIALSACKDIIGYLESDNFKSVFGEIEIITANTTQSLWVFDLRLTNGRKKRCILRALGANQQVRGINIDNQRPDIAVIDDVEDLENTDSPELQKKLDRWIFGPFMKALSKSPKIIWLGNMLSPTSLLARLSQNEAWNPVVYGAIVKDSQTGELRPLWPSRWTLEALLEDFREYKRLGQVSSWLCEMMNMPGHADNGFSLTDLNYQPVPPPDMIRAAWITVDPAFGLEKESDESAVVVHALPEDGIPMVVDYWHAKVVDTELFDVILSLATKWNAWVWGIESVAAQRVLMSLFNMLLAARFMSGKVQMIPLISGRGDPKIGRIRAWVSLLASKEYAIPDWDMDIGTQLASYDIRTKKNKDDLLDACAYGPKLFDDYLPLLILHYKGSYTELPKATYGQEITGVF